jgi:hypothetical protein
VRPWATIGLALLLLVPQGAAQTQDELLDQAATFGDAALFAAYPTLLAVQVNIVTRLQSSTLTAADLAALGGLLQRMQTLRDLHGRLAGADRAKVIDALVTLQQVRNVLAATTQPNVAPLVPLVRFAVDLEIDAYVRHAEAILGQQSRSTQRLELLSAARDAAAAIQDPVEYSRLDAAYKALDASYTADVARARRETDRAKSLLDRAPPSGLVASYPRDYADALAARRDVGQASALFHRHGETEEEARAQGLSTQLSQRIGHVGRAMALALGLELVVALAVGWVIASRVLTWSYDQRKARWGDELALQV